MRWSLPSMHEALGLIPITGRERGLHHRSWCLKSLAASWLSIFDNCQRVTVRWLLTRSGKERVSLLLSPESTKWEAREDIYSHVQRQRKLHSAEWPKPSASDGGETWHLISFSKCWFSSLSALHFAYWTSSSNGVWAALACCGGKFLLGL
jgi:hypothetical protein